MFDSNSNIWPEPEQQRANFNPKQLEFKFFWPLTEQIPLDLDFTGCEKEKLYTNTIIGTGGTGATYTFANTWTNTTITAGNLQLDVDTTTIKTKGKPPFIRRVLYKLLGLKWESK